MGAMGSPAGNHSVEMAHTKVFNGACIHREYAKSSGEKGRCDMAVMVYGGMAVASSRLVVPSLGRGTIIMMNWTIISRVLCTLGDSFREPALRFGTTLMDAPFTVY